MFLTIVGISMGLVFTGCMMTPVSESAVDRTDGPLRFTGSHLHPHAAVQIQARGTDGHFVTIAHTRSSATPSVLQTGWRPLHTWNVQAPIPPEFWRLGELGGFSAVARAVTDDGSLVSPLYTFPRNWLTCLGANRTLQDFLGACQSSTSPDLLIHTVDWNRVQPRLAPHMRLCPIAQENPLGGRNFAGPVVVHADVQLTTDGVRVFADFTVSAQGLVAGIPRVSTDFAPIILFDASLPEHRERLRGFRITRVFPDHGSATGEGGPIEGFEFIGCNNGPRIPRESIRIRGGLIRDIEMIGDTGNDDISNDRNCRCDTQVRSVTFSPIHLVFERV